MNFKSVKINLLLTTLSAGVLLQTLEAQAASITFDPWGDFNLPTVIKEPTTTPFATGGGNASPRTLKAFAEAISTDVQESWPRQSARTIISLSNFFTVTPETGEQNGDQVRGFLSGRLEGVLGARRVDVGNGGFFYSSVVASVNAGGFQPWNSSRGPIISRIPGSIPLNEPINLEGILTIGQRYQLDMRLEVFAATLIGNSQPFSNFSGDGQGLTVNIQTEPVPEPLTMLASATALGFGALLKRQNSKNQKKS
jgi:hypothetical protein